MKKAVFYLSIIVFLAFSVFIFADEGINYSSEEIEVAKIKRIESKSEYEALKEGLNKSRDTYIEFAQELAYDKEKDTYFSSNSYVHLKQDSKASLFLFEEEDGRFLNILGKNSTGYQELKLKITNTPILKVETIKQKRKPMKRPYDKVIITAFDPNPKSIPEKYQIKMRPRGRSSMAYEKKSYTIKNLDKKEMSIYGLPMNEKYVLNSMYEDEYKIRDVLSWNIWSESSAYENERNIFNSTDMIYVEVFIDNSYEGMYGLQDYVNEYKLALKDTKGSLIQSDSLNYPSLEDFNPNELEWNELAIKYSNLPDGEKWFGFERYIEEFAELPLDQNFVKENMDLESFLDYYVFTEFISAWDNMWHNTFFSKTTANPKLMITPWDLDQTFGAKWTGILPYLSETDFEDMPIIYDRSNTARYDSRFFIQRLVENYDGFQVEAAKRYFQFREDIWSEERILDKIKFYQDYLEDTGIYERDLERWPSSPRIVEGQEEFISEFMIRRMEKLDDFFNQVLKEAEQ